MEICLARFTLVFTTLISLAYLIDGNQNLIIINYMNLVSKFHFILCVKFCGKS